ncbi:MAG: DUF1080 domain-containing protein [Opitutaceae bacterium]|nr:DUF1080 domain-containing protein [Opitutaceae bacterium]
MKLPCSSLFLVSLGCAALALSTHAADTGFKNIFNGKDLAGWEGLPGFWTVRDGAITGQTTADRVLKSNTFLIWKAGELKNFELRVQFRLTVNNEQGFANSGIQYRSKVIDPAGFVVGGYQADMDTGRYIGMLYEEKGRGILMQPGQKIHIGKMAAAEKSEGQKKGKQKAPVETIATVTTPEQLAAAYRKGEWNEIAIIARGNHLQHFINGTLTADVTDGDPEKGAKSGVLALQLHQGHPMTVQFKDVRLKTLP